MKRVTFFTAPKAFVGMFDVIQQNAINSWVSLCPKPEIILCGNDNGIANFAAEKKLLHVPDIKVSESGVPRLDDMFLRASDLASNDILVYTNCDMIFTQDIILAIEKVDEKFPEEFLIVGQRIDVAIPELIDFTKSNWEDNLRNQVAKTGKLHPVCGIDYFVFRKKSWRKFPPFIVGRIAWDNWFMGEALRRNHDVIDATTAIFAVHSNHDYSHAPTIANIRKCKDADLNRSLAREKPVFINSANWKFINKEIKRK